MKQLRELVYYAFLSGLMFYGFIATIFQHRMFIAFCFILLFSLDVWKALKTYDKVKEEIINESYSK